MRVAGYVVFALVIVGVVAAADWGRLSDAFFRSDVARSMFPEAITVALRNTIAYTLLAFAFGLTVGLALALMRLSSILPYRWFATAYIELFRGLPALLVLFMVGYGVPLAFPDREIPGGVYGSVTVGLGLTAAAYMAETLRAGIQAVPKGQLEAARTLGMSHARAMVSIVLPQAFRIVIPPLTNEIILLTKDTSLVYVLGVTSSTIELTKFAGDALNQRVNPTPLVVAGLLYLVITLPLSQVVRGLERRAARER
ncbi:amino acid ABC transporter permease [Paractinoplanes abujensis]|uniref:Polar amino acid transport system permease protein n=1 Tax=Paractinoplanes abujensis TaxID=882441 RepID=A0A7W7CMX8_9ACTN|nr:amino acid ABC transporter permease [Actinoplanes abujensis]MBB4690018.1 polar amino acid transport system permease protein [Actinoplanes abujensis]GID20790.1 amino acid ABC transporter permease [Actinoplanes abujensis]